MKVKENAPAPASTSNIGLSEDRHVELKLIASTKQLPHRPIDKAHADELFDSIRRSGLDTRLVVWGGEKENTVMKMGDGSSHPATFLIAGAHRRAALQRLQKEDPKRFKELFPDGVPCVVRTCTLAEALLIQLRENVQRKEMAPETILPVLKHLTELGLKQNIIAARIGKSTGWVSQMLDISKNLGEEGLEEIANGGTTIRDARKAAKEVQSGKSSAKEAVAKMKEAVSKKRGKNTRAERKVSLKTLFNRYSILPTSTKLGEKVTILEGIIEYAIGESENIPAAVDQDEEDSKPAKK